MTHLVSNLSALPPPAFPPPPRSRIPPLSLAFSESIWNAASFYQESSYLYFPTLQAELSSDISLFFKTSAPSGVFLENLGLKDFIRLELSCESRAAPMEGKKISVANGGSTKAVSAAVTLPLRPLFFYFFFFPFTRNSRPPSLVWRH